MNDKILAMSRWQTSSHQRNNIKTFKWRQYCRAQSDTGESSTL